MRRATPYTWLRHLALDAVRDFRVVVVAFHRFNAIDGWAIASHISLSTLMAMFPFLIVVGALAGFFGSRHLGNEAAQILLESWPRQVAAPISIDIKGVLTSASNTTLTFSVVFSVYFAASGVESLRIALNRSYGVVEHRNWLLLRLESIGYVLVGAVGLLVFALLVVFAPLIWEVILRYLPHLAPFSTFVTLTRFVLAGGILVAALVVVHLWLPAGRRKLRDIFPGIVATLSLWLISGAAFGRYLTAFAFNYFNMYASLGSAVIALFFLYITASIFIYGGELNAAVMEARETAARPLPPTPAPDLDQTADGT